MIKKYWIAFIIPGIFIIFTSWLKIATGPYWQFPDPCYGYLTSSLSLIKGLSPQFNYQPGVSVQILGALVIFLSNLGHSSADTVHRALLNPDHYLNLINISMLVFIFITSLILGVYIYRQTEDKLAVVLSQLPILIFLSLRSYSFFDYVPPVVTNASPEALLIGISCLFNLCFLKLFFAKKYQEEVLMAILLGIICGLGISTRLTFFPLLLLPLIVCRGSTKILFLAASFASCFFWTIPIIPSYAWIWDWVVRLSTHVGEYGSGGEGIINLPAYLSNWHIILNKCALLVIFTLVAVMISLIQLIKNYRHREALFVLAVSFCILVQLAIIAKHYDEHYLVSAISLFAPLFVLFFINIKDRHSLIKPVILIFIAIFIFQSLSKAIAYDRQLSAYTNDAVAFNKMIHIKYSDSALIGVMPMPMAVSDAAFFWGNDRDNNVEDEILSLYPQSLVYFSDNVNDHAPYETGIYSIKQRVWADDLIRTGAHIIFIAPKTYDFSQTPYTVLPLEQGKYAGAFLLVGSVEKQANNLFDDAVKLSEKGDFPQAFAFALKSKELHYQPADKVDYIIRIIYLHLKQTTKDH